MIRTVTLNDLQICSDVIKNSFVPVAVKFNITKEEVNAMKKFIVIADIHSNYAAFQSAYNQIEKINPDGIFFSEIM